MAQPRIHTHPRGSQPLTGRLADYRGRNGLAAAISERLCAQSDDPKNFRATSVELRLITVTVTEMTLTPHRGEWRTDSRADEVALVFVVAGAPETGPHGEHTVGVRILRPGEVVHYRSALDLHTVTVSVPWAALPGGVEAVLRSAPATTLAPSPLSAAVTSFLHGLIAAAADEHPDDLYHLERAVTAMIGALVADGLGATTDQLRREERLVARAQELIVLRHADAAFGPDELAAELGTSERTLQRAFTAHGATIARAIRAERVRRIAQELRADQGPASFRDLVRAHGFERLGHAGRAFRAEHGMSMGEYRANR